MNGGQGSTTSYSNFLRVVNNNFIVIIDDLIIEILYLTCAAPLSRACNKNGRPSSLLQSRLNVYTVSEKRKFSLNQVQRANMREIRVMLITESYHMRIYIMQEKKGG